jgi:hypothetical protein
MSSRDNNSSTQCWRTLTSFEEDKFSTMLEDLNVLKPQCRRTLMCWWTLKPQIRDNVDITSVGGS